MKHIASGNYFSLIKIFCIMAMLGAGFTLSAEEIKKLIRFQSPNSNITNISGAELKPMLTEDDVVESVETNGVTLVSEAHTSTTGFIWGSIRISDGLIKFNLLPSAPGFISKVSLQTTGGSSSPENVAVNGVADYKWRDNNSQYIDFTVNKKAGSVTIACNNGYIDFEEVAIFFGEPLKPAVYNEDGHDVAASPDALITGQLLKIVSTGADMIYVKHNGADKYTLEGEEVEFRPMEPGEYTFIGSNELGKTDEYSILVTVNQPKEGQRLTPVTDESGLLPGYLYVYQVSNGGKTLALGTDVKTFPGLDDEYPVALELKGDGNSYQNGMETMLLDRYIDGWSWKLTNMGKYIAIDPPFGDDPQIYKVTFVQGNAELSAKDYTPVYRFCYSTKAECFTVLPESNQNYLLGRLYRVDPIAALPIADPEDVGDDQTVTVNGEKCVTRTLTVSFPATAGTSASNYVLRYGDIDLTTFELIDGNYVATATLPYIKGADLMIISSDSNGAGSFSLGNPWKDLENTIVEQPIDIPAVITIDVATGKASFRQALNFESDNPCELEISEESHPSGELIKENDGRYYYVIEDYIKNIKTDSHGAPIFTEADKADVNYDVTPVFKVAGASSATPARAAAREAEPGSVYTLRGTTVTHNYTSESMSVSGIADISTDTPAAPETYYTVDGIALGSDIPSAPGLYIRRCGTTVIKVLVK